MKEDDSDPITSRIMNGDYHAGAAGAASQAPQRPPAGRLRAEQRGVDPLSFGEEGERRQDSAQAHASAGKQPAERTSHMSIGVHGDFERAAAKSHREEQAQRSERPR